MHVGSRSPLGPRHPAPLARQAWPPAARVWVNDPTGAAFYCSGQVSAAARLHTNVISAVPGHPDGWRERGAADGEKGPGGRPSPPRGVRRAGVPGAEKAAAARAAEAPKAEGHRRECHLDVTHRGGSSPRTGTVVAPAPLLKPPGDEVYAMIGPLRYQVGAPQTAAKPHGWREQRTAPPSAAVASPATGSFVFHDASGQRWSRIKRVIFAAAAAVAVIGGAVLLALT